MLPSEYLKCQCGALLLIAPSGLVCEHGCGRLLSAAAAVELTGFDLGELRKLFVGRVIEPSKEDPAKVPAVKSLTVQMELAFVS